MGNVVGWLITGLFICALGGIMMLQDDEIAEPAGLVLLAVGGVVTQIGAIAVGVFVALRERDRSVS